ncbi:MAG: FimB/Mfa2 family fimbrial subunit, partial [Tannerellaceae bacterium]|nr:FimB/Mfa2 family fimbrial subunit [Tannerellaceae bacterium]
LTGCNESDDKIGPAPGEEGTPGSLTIRLAGTSSTRATAPADFAFESTVHTFNVYVFNANNNTLETFQNVSSGTTTTFNGLSSGFKKNVVVIVNPPAGFPVFDEGDEYSKFTEAASGIDLDTQSPALAQSNGLIMYGETDSNTPIQLDPANPTTITVEVARLVAKVTLGTITIIPEDNYDIDDLEITAVSIQRAVSKIDIFGNPLTDYTQMYCGVLGSYNSTVKTYLLDPLTPGTWVENVPQTFDNYFYVFPNQPTNDDDHCTLLTISSTYDGFEQYFPVRINYQTTSDVNTSYYLY